MTEEQEAVVGWMHRILRDRAWTADQWAKMAHVSPTTVTRAMHDDYASTTSLPILQRLARAAGVVSPVDFLATTAKLPSQHDLEMFLDGYLAANAQPDARKMAEALRTRFAFGASSTTF